jgi:iron complex transport system ATP-binding protein
MTAASDDRPTAPAVRLRHVGLRTEEVTILDDVSLDIGHGELWVLLGRNGAGKTSLLRLCGAQRVPSSGDVAILGREVGRTDLRVLRGEIALVSQAVENQLRPQLTAREVVLAGKDGSLVPWWQEHSGDEVDRAESLLKLVGLTPADRAKSFGTLSTGERKRTLLARALMSGSRLLLLDEPLSGLDLGAREDVLDVLCEVFVSHADTAILVTHHLEEIPQVASHAALLAGGRLTAAGPLADVLTPERVSACFGRPIDVHHRDGRWHAFPTPGLAPASVPAPGARPA